MVGCMPMLGIHVKSVLSGVFWVRQIGSELMGMYAKTALSQNGIRRLL